jgi:hypothetical protein
MPIMSKNVFVVKCDKVVFEKNFSRKKNSDIINRYEIRQKLINNDSSKNPPSEEIVNFQIIKKLNVFKECKKTEFVYFVRESIDSNFVSTLKNLFTRCDIPVFFHLLSDVEVEEMIKESFNSVQILEYDKNGII